MLNKKVQVEFIKHGTHNLFGTIWPTRVITTNKAIAEKLIRQGSAKWPDDEDTLVIEPKYSSKKVEKQVNDAGLTAEQIGEIIPTGSGDKITKADVDTYLDTLADDDAADDSDGTEE